MRTRRDTFPTGSGKTYYVGPDGDDANPGTREKPFATIQHAADLAEPGDTIYLKNGTYRESVTVTRSGRPDAYILLAVDPEETVPPMHISTMDGAGLVKRFHARAHLAGWVPAAGAWDDLGSRLYALAETRRVGTVTMSLPHPEDDYRPVGTRIYHHGSLDELKQAEPPLVPGWWQDEQAGRLYLHLASGEGKGPGAYTVRLGVLPFGLKFQDAAYWVVDGLAVDLFGGGPYSRGIEVRGGEGVVIRRCQFHCMRTGVRIGKGAERCLVQRCDFRDNAIWEWPWHACKSHDVEGCAVSLSGGAGNVVRDNYIEGFFNGIAPATWGDLENDRINADMDVHHNRFYHVADDCLEPEGSCMNVRFWHNRAFNVFMGLSVAPVTVGPCWVVRDRYVHFKRGGLKVSCESRGVTYVYHTLFWQDNPDRNATGVCGPWGNMHFRNCIFRGTKYAIEDDREHTAPCSFDYCCLHATREEPLVKWAGKRYSRLRELPKEEGFGTHNLDARPYRGTKDGRPEGLAPELIDAGVRLPGINDGYLGDGPDIGPDEVR
ncbi:MAG: right-handed parallel beta-helix repeat-containing protein [Planctomycetota bacterium]|nr:right-handed parallel beta-helix repeat-containing protein [Planctomycetota bacterium]